MLISLPSLAVLPHSFGPYAALMLAGFGIGVLGHLTRSRWLVAVGILCVFLGAFLFPLALNLTTEKPSQVLDYPPR
ncbi:MAG: hypothetical protein U0R52_11420 [Solirubrobacterales bacterium]